MAVRRVQLRRGTTADHTNGDGFTGAVGEITVDTTTKSIRVHDGDQAGGFDLMRADMSNNLAVVGNINFTDDAHVIGGDINTNGQGGDPTHILDLGSADTTVRVRGTLNVATQTTQNDLLIQDKVIVIADGTEGLANSTDSIGILFTRTTDGPGPGAAQDPALFYWDESTDRFRVETNNVTEANDDWTGGTGADLTLKTLYAQTSVDVNNGDITNVGEIQLDSIIYNDDLNTITIKAKDNQASAFVVKADAGDSEEYISINATNATESLTLGVPSKEVIIRGNLTTLGTNADPGVSHKIQVETTTAVAGQDLTIEAGTTSLAGNTSGGDLILSTGGGTGAGTASMQFKTLVANGLTPAERMRIHTDGNVGIGDSAPGTLLQLSGTDAYLTLKNTTVEHTDGGAETKIIFEDHGNNALGQIEVSHQGILDDEFGQMIFSTNNDAGLQTALTIDKDQKATFAGVVSVATSLDMTDGAIDNVTTIDLDKITDRANDGIIIEIHDGQATGLVIEDTNGLDFITCNAAADTITLHQATTLSSTLSVNGGSATVQAATGADANLYLVADNSEDGGDVWRVQAPDASRTLTFAGENDASNGYVDVLTLTGANAGADTSATVKGTLIVEGEIHSNTDLVFRVDADQGAVAGDHSFSFKNGDDSEVASLTEAGVLTVTGVANLNGGIAVDTDNFTVDGATGAIDTKSTLQVDGNVRIGENGLAGSPTFTIVEHTGGVTKFQVAGATGDTTIGGTSETTGIATFKDSLAIQSQPVNDLGIRFNSDRGANNINGADYDVKVIDVFKGTGNATQGTILWDDDQSSFSITSGKLNSETQFSVGPIATPNFTVAPTTGAVAMVGTDAYLTLKNNVDEFNDGGAETQIQFQDHAGLNLSTIQASHEGALDDAKGQLLFYTNTGAENDEGTLALTISSAQLATFEGNVTVSGNTITFGNSATIVNGAADTLTITEDNIKFAGITHITAATGANAILYMSADASEDNADDWRLQATDGNLFSVASYISGAYQDFFSIAGDVNTLLSTTTVEGKLVVKGASISGITDGDLAIASDGNLTFHIDADNDEASIFSFVHGAGAGTEVAQIDESGNLQIDGDLTLGGNTINSGDGTGTITLANDGSDAKIESQLTVIGDGAGTSSIVLGQNDGNNSVITTAVRSGGDNLAGNDLTIIGGASTGTGAGGSIIFKTVPAGVDGGVTNGSVNTLTLDSTKQATFEGNVVIKGNLDIQQTGTNTIIDSTSLVVADPVIELARNADAAANASTDVGFVFTRGSAENPAVIYWDEGEDKFVFATKQGAVAGTTDFSVGNAPVEARLDVGTLNADIITLDDNDATSLVIKEAGNSYLTFNTLNADPGDGSGFEQVEFNKVFKAISGSKIGNLTLADGSITSSGGAIDFDNENLSTTGTLGAGTTTVTSLDVTAGGITRAGAISGATTLATINQITLDTTADILLADNQATSLDIRETNLGSYLMFDTQDGQAQVVVNEGGADIDFRVEGDGNANLIFARASDDRVGIKTANPLFDLDITGTLGVSSLADLNGGIDVNGSNFTVDSAGAVKAVGTLSLTDASGGILFNSDLTAENAQGDAPMLTVERGILTNAIIAWDETRDEFNINSVSGVHLVGKNASNALTVGGANSAAGGVTFSVTTAGAVTSIGGITDTTVASSFASGTTLGNVTYSNNEIAGADNQDLTIKSEQDLIFQVDSDQVGDVAGNNSFFFKNGGAGTILTLAESGDLTTTGNLTVATAKSITLNSGAAGADADIIVDRTDGNNAILRWVEANDRFEVDNATGAFYKLLTENDTLFNIDVDGDNNTLAISQDPTHTILFKGSNVADNQGLIFTLDGDTIELGFEATVKMPGALTLGAGDVTAVNVVATTQFYGPEAVLTNDLQIRSSADNSSAKTAILLNSNQAGNPAATEDVSIEVERGDDPNAKFTWDEGDLRWTLTQGPDASQYTKAIVTTQRSEGARPETVGTSNNGGGGDLEFGTAVANRLDLTAQQPTANENEHIYFLDNNGTSGTVDLFTLAGTTYNGYKINFVNIDTVDMVIDANAAQTINGQLTQTIPAGGNLTIVAFGTSWYIL